MRRLTAFTILAAMCAALVLGTCGRAAAAEKYNFGVTVLKGLSMGSLSQMMKELAKVLSKKINADVAVKEMPYEKGGDEVIFQKVLKEMKAGKLDFALVQSPMQYLKYKAQADAAMTPFFAMAINGKPGGRVCAFVNKNSTAKTIADLKGKTYGGSHTLQMRVLMNSENINVPMKSFYKNVVFIDDTDLTNPMNALINNKIDVYSTISYLGDMARGANKEYLTNIKVLKCADFEHNWIFVHRKGVSPEVVEKVRTIMINAHKDKDFNQFKFMMTAIKGKFVGFDPANLKTTAKLVELNKKYGWEKEEHTFIKSNMK